MRLNENINRFQVANVEVKDAFIVRSLLFYTLCLHTLELFQEGDVLNYYNVPRIKINTQQINNTLISKLRIEVRHASDLKLYEYLCKKWNIQRHVISSKS